jgi:superfamily II DNA or RNA helicase
MILEARSYEVLRPVRERALLLGITATPERQDGHDLLAWCD